MFSHDFQEDKPPGYTVLELEVTDADTDVNGPPFKFDIVEGAPDHEFRVDSNGVLTTAARFDRDIKDVYDLVIRVYDNGSPSLYSETTVSYTKLPQAFFFRTNKICKCIYNSLCMKWTILQDQSSITRIFIYRN